MLVGSAGFWDELSRRYRMWSGRALLFEGVSEQQEPGWHRGGGDMSAPALTLGSLCIWKLPRFSPWLLGFSLRVWEGVKHRWMEQCLLSLKTNV